VSTLQDCSCAFVEERPFRAASEGLFSGALAPSAPNGPAAPRQPTRLFHSVILSEAKDPMHCASVEERPFRAASEGLFSGALAPECS